MILLEPCFVEKVLVFNDGFENVDEIFVVIYHPVIGKFFLKMLVVVVENPESSLGLFNTFQMKLGVDDIVGDFLWKIPLLQYSFRNSRSRSHDNIDFRTIEKVLGDVQIKRSNSMIQFYSKSIYGAIIWVLEQLYGA